MTVFVTKPSDWAVPLDQDHIPQLAYQHKPAGSPPLRFGRLEPTGPLPAAINFPMVPTRPTDEFSCVVMGDAQPYSNTEVGYVRDSIVNDLLSWDLTSTECMLLLGDVKSSHVWRVQLPADLPLGVHVAEVTSVDRYGQVATDYIAFEVLAERPDPFWRTEPWQDGSVTSGLVMDERGLPVLADDGRPVTVDD